MVQAAVFDAINAIDGTPAYYVKLTAPAGASASAAVSEAAYTVLSYLYPAQKASLDGTLADSLAEVQDGQSKTDGITLGQQAGNAIIKLSRATVTTNSSISRLAQPPANGSRRRRPTPSRSIRSGPPCSRSA